MTIILSIDPGNVSGVALFDLSEPTVQPVAAERNTFPLYDEVWEWFLDSADVKVDEVVAERFVISQRTIQAERQNDALNILGFLDGLCYIHRVPFALQTPAQAKQFATDKKLRALGWWKPTKGGHANDALRHLLTYLATHHRKTPGVDEILKRSIA